MSSEPLIPAPSAALPDAPAAPGPQMSRPLRWRDAVELLASMRFAIALLTLIAVASVIGTVLKQNEPYPNYVNQFGPFWADLFDKLALYTVYGSWWFLLILAFLVVSTSLCIARKSPKILVEMRGWKEGLRERALRAIHDHDEQTSSLSREALRDRLGAMLTDSGYRYRIDERSDTSSHDGQASLLAAKTGAANRLGYILAHSAIVIICLGGLLDGDLLLRIQLLAGGKHPLPPNQQTVLLADVPAGSRMGAGNPSFRGNVFVPEGATTGAAILSTRDGTIVQDLPFSITLKKFVVDYYATGMPKLFASDIVVTDRETGQRMQATVKVNEPFIYKGVAIYQSSFEDGGSALRLTGYPMRGAASQTFALKGTVGDNTRLTQQAGESYTVEFSGLRPINVENMTDGSGRTDARGVAKSGLAQLEARLGSGAKTSTPKNLRNVGPSVQYKLRDATGQAREFSNYMLPVKLDGQSVFLAGVRDQPDEAFRYLRIPADADGSVRDWMRLRAALQDSAQRREAAHRYAAHYAPAGVDAAQRDRLRTQLEASAAHALDLFSGAVPAPGAPSGAQATPQGGFQALAALIEKTVPAAEQQKAAEVLLKILEGAVWEVWQLSRARAGLPAAPNDEASASFLQAAVNALSDSAFYGAPFLLTLDSFDEVKASVFQVTRSPGKIIVYLGCLLLVAGVFAMFYIRERRLWILVKAEPGGGSRALMAMSSTRRTLDFDNEVAQMRTRLAQCAQP